MTITQKTLLTEDPTILELASNYLQGLGHMDLQVESFEEIAMIIEREGKNIPTALAQALSALQNDRPFLLITGTNKQGDPDFVKLEPFGPGAYEVKFVGGSVRPLEYSRALQIFEGLAKNRGLINAGTTLPLLTT